MVMMAVVVAAVMGQYAHQAKFSWVMYVCLGTKNDDSLTPLSYYAHL